MQPPTLLIIYPVFVRVPCAAVALELPLRFGAQRKTLESGGCSRISAMKNIKFFSFNIQRKTSAFWEIHSYAVSPQRIR